MKHGAATASRSRVREHVRKKNIVSSNLSTATLSQVDEGKEGKERIRRKGKSKESPVHLSLYRSLGTELEGTEGKEGSGFSTREVHGLSLAVATTTALSIDTVINQIACSDIVIASAMRSVV